MSSNNLEHSGRSPSQASSETAVPQPEDGILEKLASPEPRQTGLKQAGDYGTIAYPEPWKHEKWFPGGYSQTQMLKFKHPKRMYYGRIILL